MAQEVLAVTEQDRPLVLIPVRDPRCRLEQSSGPENTEAYLENSKQPRVESQLRRQSVSASARLLSDSPVAPQCQSQTVRGLSQRRLLLLLLLLMWGDGRPRPPDDTRLTAETQLEATTRGFHFLFIRPPTRPVCVVRMRSLD